MSPTQSTQTNGARRAAWSFRRRVTDFLFPQLLPGRHHVIRDYRPGCVR